MRYYVTVAGRSYEVEVTGEKVTVDGQAHAVDLAEVNGTPLRRLSVDGASHRVVAAKGEERGQWQLHVDGYRVNADVVDERTHAIRALTTRNTASHGPRPIRAPMPGLVTRVEVQPGESVRAGQGVIIIEAMKMENELKAEAAGVVARIAVNAGTAVEKGTILVEFTSHD